MVLLSYIWVSAMTTRCVRAWRNIADVCNPLSNLHLIFRNVSARCTLIRFPLLGLKDGAELKPQALGSVAYEECATRPAYAGSAETAFPSGGYLEVDAEFEVAGNNEMSADASANMDC